MSAGTENNYPHGLSAYSLAGLGAQVCNAADLLLLRLAVQSGAALAAAALTIRQPILIPLLKSQLGRAPPLGRRWRCGLLIQRLLGS